MVFPKISLPSKSTLSGLASMPKPPITTVLKAVAMTTPLGMVAVGGLAVGGLALANKDKIKSTLGGVKNEAVKVGNTIEKGAVSVGNGIKSGAKSVGNGLQSLMMPVMVIGTLAVILMILKK